MTGVETEDVQLGHLVALLPAYTRARSEKASAEKDVERIGGLFKDWLGEHPGEVIWDGESGIEASLKTRRVSGRTYDLLTLWDQNRALFERLLKTGCLKVDESAVKNAGPNVGGVEQYAFPQGETTYLDVRVVK
jgi:hypothetical protein